MTVTRIEAISKTKYRIFLDNEFAFVLYKGELSHYHIEEDAVINEAAYLEIKQKVILKRAKLRALHLLNDMDRTEGQLREKLRAGQYTEDIIDEAMNYVKSFGYVNDLNYAKRFVDSRKDKKSRKEIYAQLCNKGLSKTLIEEAMEDCYDKDDGMNAITELLRKKKYDPETATEKDKQKVIAFLMRKGFSYHDIRQVVQVSEWNT